MITININWLLQLISSAVLIIMGGSMVIESFHYYAAARLERQLGKVYEFEQSRNTGNFFAYLGTALLLCGVGLLGHVSGLVKYTT